MHREAQDRCNGRPPRGSRWAFSAPRGSGKLWLVDAVGTADRTGVPALDLLQDAAAGRAGRGDRRSIRLAALESRVNRRVRNDEMRLRPDGTDAPRIPKMIVEVRLLDGFTIAVDGTPIPASRWSRRDASALVKILALSPRGRLHRDRVLDRLWPDATVDVALPRLHKAAHFARRALGDPAAVVLKDEVVALFPAAEVVVDASTFESSAVAALAADALSPSDCAEALKLAGDLLPDDLREPWLDEPRQRLRASCTFSGVRVAGTTWYGSTRRTRRRISSSSATRSRSATVPARCAVMSGWNRSCPPSWASVRHPRRSSCVSGC